MRASVAGGSAEARVEMSVGVLLHLAAMLERLGEAVAEPQPPVAPDSFAAPIDGIRWWVPAPELTRVHREVEELRRETELLRNETWLAQMTSR